MKKAVSLFVFSFVSLFTAVEAQKFLYLTDKPVGFCDAVQQDGDGVTVTTKAELFEALSKGGLIYVNGMIDLSEGLIPSVGGESTPELDEFVRKNTDGEFSSYLDFKDAYVSNCTIDTEDKSSSKPESKYGALLWKLNKAYKKIIQPKVVSDTTIIGVNDKSGFHGGTIVLSGVSNFVIRNLTIEDGYDPFPHHEDHDGYNAQFDAIGIQSGSHDIWIDHCTFRDTMKIGHVKTGGTYDEKWQNYDGLLDMKSEGTTNITVSWCRFENHDKTMLIGSSDKEWDGCHRYVTLHHNLFYNCAQRLPMVRQTNIHIYNNCFYSDINSPYMQLYCIGIRNKTKAVCENNCFSYGIRFSYDGTPYDDLKGTLYRSGDLDESISSIRNDHVKEIPKKVVAINYPYTLDSAEGLMELLEEKSGAGKFKVRRAE